MEDFENKSADNLPAINTSSLNSESLELINKIIAESDQDKLRDLTYLFNINQNKKTIARMDKLNELQDLLVDQFSQRISKRPDEISTEDLMKGLKVVQEMLERGQKTVSGTQEAPLIQINQQSNSLHVDSNGVEELSRESREKIKNAVGKLLSGILPQGQQEQPFNTALENTEDS